MEETGRKGSRRSRKGVYNSPSCTACIPLPPVAESPIHKATLRRTLRLLAMTTVFPSINTTPLRCLSDLIRELEDGARPLTLAGGHPARTTKPGRERDVRRRSSSADSFNDSGLGSELSDSQTSIPRKGQVPAPSRHAVSRSLSFIFLYFYAYSFSFFFLQLDLVQQLLDYYLEGKIARDDPPITLPDGEERKQYQAIERFINALNLNKPNVWTVGGHFAFRFLSTPGQRSEQCFAIEPLLKQSIRLYLTVLVSVHFLF